MRDDQDTPTIGKTASVSKTISEADITLFAGITLDCNPLHIDDEYAKKSRFKGRIAHGMLTAGLISAVLGTKLPGFGSIYLSQSLKFLNPVRIGDTITAMVRVTNYIEEKRIVTLETRCENQNGIEVLSGEATMLLEGI